MMVVIFEVVPNPGCQERYLEIAADLKSSLSNIEGFISIERFQSMVNPERLLSLSFW
ncbi:antibiotic biosynthesis monooxygenase family protein, partial [Pseudomonas saponiphila]